ncbi:uncharacterized protein LOC118434014 [Folsomia candida]|uniref:uncharacterized protein LOC118434014 n=1 Tax=Folsomia candida TaxID=158441 RepID=UPI00160526AD|nr:uncharacterized protein LOC118434014 [Folsomia candida]
MKDCTVVNGEEMWQFFALALIIKLDTKDDWSTSSMFSTRFFGQVMSRNSCFNISEKLSGWDLSRGGRILTFLQREIIIQAISQIGMKLYLLCDSAGRFVLKVLPYQERTTRTKNSNWIQELGFGGATVMTLLHAIRLKQLGTYILGTVQKWRKLMRKLTDKGTSCDLFFLRHFSGTGCVCKFTNKNNTLKWSWSDRREMVLNTFMGHRMEEVATTNPNNNREKPATDLVYNVTMGAVDNIDRVTKPFTSVRKSCKWYKKYYSTSWTFTIRTSFTLLSAQRSYKDFVRVLVREILEKYSPQHRSLGRKSNSQLERQIGTHFPEKIVVDNVSVFRDCQLCCLEGKMCTTAFRCETCLKSLCIRSKDSCFKRFHTLSKLPVKRKRSNANASSGSTSQSIVDVDQSVPRPDSEIGLGFGEANEVRFQEANVESNVEGMEEEEEELFSI